MKEKPAQSPIFRRRECVRACSILLCCAVLIGSGCAERKRPTLAWAAAVQVRPILRTRTTTVTPEEPLPDLKLEFPPQPVRLVVVHSAPVRPRVAPPPSPENAPAAKTEAPLIVPQLSSAESQTLQEQTNQSASAAAKNLSAASGKTLNVTQTDLVSKIRSFLSDSEEAGRAGDWRRARNLARKAEVLSQELVGSL
jgi:hypothetical protein